MQNTEILRELEERLLNPAVRRDAEQVKALLTDDFREFGRSGRTYDKAQILQLLAIETGVGVTLTVSEFAANVLGEGVVLATYVSTRTDVEEKKVIRALRSSVWVEREGRWQMRFHQGTLMP